MTTSTAAQRDTTLVILDHLARYRLTVPDALAKTPGLRAVRQRLIKQHLRGLMRDGRVGRATLYGTRPYYYLTSRRVAPRTASARAPHLGPLSELAKIRSFSMLAFCQLSGTLREKMTAVELVHLIPEFTSSGNRDNYYVEVTSSSKRYGHALIDAGTPGRWDRILKKLRDDVRRHLQFESIRTLHQEQRFEWTILTAMPQKAARLRETMAHLPELRGVQVRVCANPELIYLIAPPAA